MLTTAQLAGMRHFDRNYTYRLGLLAKHVFDTNLSWPEARVLMLIAETAPTSPKTVAAGLALDRSYTSRLINRLMAQSLLTKTPSPEDSRAVILELTAAGKQLNDTLNQLSDQQLRQLLDPLSPEEQQQVFDAIETLNRLLLP